MQSAPDRDNFVTIMWNNIEAGNVSVFTHNKHNKVAPVPCAHRTHTDITFTPHSCHHYVQQQWLFKQRAGIAEKILDAVEPHIYLQNIYQYISVHIFTAYL
jgi:hypothetical protein